LGGAKRPDRDIMNKKAWFFIFLFVLLAGCVTLPIEQKPTSNWIGSSTPPTTITLVAATLTPTPSAFTPIPERDFPTQASPTLEKSPDGLAVNSATPESTEAEVLPKYQSLKIQCLQSATALPSSASLSGVVIIREKGSHRLVKMPELSQQPLVSYGQEVFSLELSPDRKHVVFVKCRELLSSSGTNKCVVVVATADGQEVNSFPDSSVVWRYWRWLDNEHLEIIHDSEPSNTAMVLDAFTNQEEVIPLHLSNPYYQQTLDYSRILLYALDPTRSRVIYFDTQGIGRVILAEVSSGKVLGWLPYPIPDDPSIQLSLNFEYGWSPDGSRYMTISPVTSTMTSQPMDELWSISLDGTVLQETHFGSDFEFSEIMYPAWSPDGRYIAFWLRKAEKLSEQPVDDIPASLAVLDRETHTVTDYCLSLGAPSDYYYSRQPIIWSPNSQQMVFSIRESTTGDIGQKLVDIVHGVTTSFKPDGLPLGWMVNPSP